MSEFLSEDFLLHSGAARELYHDYAKAAPIYDFHCHLPPDQIAENRTFRNLAEIWLAGDHYKWRAMRANGVDEKFCAGDADDWDKFLAFARTVPRAVRNPLYHWTHLELRRYFGITELLDETTAETVWKKANERLAEMPVHRILTESRVAVVCTTDDPADTLDAHKAIRASGALTTKVYPAFRPDMALQADRPKPFNAWLERLSAVSGIGCDTFDGFLDALRERHAFFHTMGGRLSDHGLPHCYAAECTQDEAGGVFAAALAGLDIDHVQLAQYRSFMMLFFGRLDAEKGWTKQLHLGPLRGNNTRLFQRVGPDTGFDSIGDFRQAEALSRYLDSLDRDNRLPKMILYNLNPADNYLVAAMAGNFQDGTIPGKIQFGSGWWFLDQKEGIEWHLNTLSNIGLLSRFVGMVTDSRSFLSYPRHEYFRRVLCNLIGRDVENGELPRDMKLLGGVVRDICFENARAYFGLEIG